MRRGRAPRRPRRRRIQLVVVALGTVVVVLFYSAASADQNSGSRRAATIRGSVHCKNTFGSSATLVADSRGNVCGLLSVGKDGCCKERRSSSCSFAESCCEEYEECVALCTASGTSTLREVRARASHALLGTKDDWDFCRFRCLTNSGSVLHQNSYRSRLKHCFGTNRATLDPTMTINSVDPHVEPDSIDTDLQDPYVAGPPFVFPCQTEGCAVPEQDRALLHKEKNRSWKRRTLKNDGASDYRRRPLHVVADRLLLRFLSIFR